MILTGDLITAQEAYRINLVNKVVPATAVVKEAMGLAKKIAEKGGVAIAKALEAINAGAQTCPWPRAWRSGDGRHHRPGHDQRRPRGHPGLHREAPAEFYG